MPKEKKEKKEKKPEVIEVHIYIHNITEHTVTTPQPYVYPNYPTPYVTFSGGSCNEWVCR